MTQQQVIQNIEKFMDIGLRDVIPNIVQYLDSRTQRELNVKNSKNVIVRNSVPNEKAIIKYIYEHNRMPPSVSGDRLEISFVDDYEDVRNLYSYYQNITYLSFHMTIETETNSDEYYMQYLVDKVGPKLYKKIISV